VTAFPADLRTALTDLARTPRLLVASDFDGTLSHLVKNPADARPVPGATEALQALAALPNTAVTLISGRALAVLSELSGAPAGVHLIGSHGAESAGGFTQQIDTGLLDTIRAGLDPIAAEYPGARVESKPAGVVLHVRNATPDVGAAALAAARAAAVSWPAKMTEGKAILEFAVIETDKGMAIDQLRVHEKATAVVFFGDDVTDEDAFRRLHDGVDVGVKVGPGETLAPFHLDTPDDVAVALELLLAERSAHRRESQ
jgi:trehalose 6-phosphate phosphatase